MMFFFFFQAEDGIRDGTVTGVQTCALPICELMDFRAVGDTIQMLAYRINFANPAADRYSRLALWQAHRTRQELDAAFKPLNIGGIQDVRVLGRGPSERPLSTQIMGSSGRTTV